MGGDAEDAARDQEKGHANARQKGQGQRRDNFKHAHGCKPTTIYPSDIPDALPWENERDSMVDSSVNLGPLKEVHLHKYL